MAEDLTGTRELVYLTRLRQTTLFAPDSRSDGFSSASAGDDCPLGCDCHPADYCDCPCHRFVPEKRRPAENTPVL